MCRGPRLQLHLPYLLEKDMMSRTSLVYCQPIFELAASRMSDPTKSVWSLRNTAPRFLFRAGYIVLTAFVGVLFPFIGNSRATQHQATHKVSSLALVRLNCLTHHDDMHAVDSMQSCMLPNCLQK